MAYADPARRSGRGRTFSPTAGPRRGRSSRSCCAATPCVKVAPGIPHDLVPDGVEAEWVSDHGEVKEAALWSGRLAHHPAPRHGDRSTAAWPRSPTRTTPGARRPRRSARFLYEPDGAVIRAGLVTAVAAGVDGGLLDEHIAYVTGDESFRTPFARGYRVLERSPTGRSRCKAALRERGIGTLTIKKRGRLRRPRRAAAAARRCGATDRDAGADPGGRARDRAARRAVLRHAPASRDRPWPPLGADRGVVAVAGVDDRLVGEREELRAGSTPRSGRRR